MKAAVIYWSKTGNTQKVAASIQKGLEESGAQASICTVADAADLDFFDYDLICLGMPSINWHPPKPVEEYLKNMFLRYKKEGRVKPGAPVLPGKYALIFCTYSGPHTGIREAIPAGKYVGQFFEHIGFNVVDEWYILSEFIGSEENNTIGRMGNIKGLPNFEDLERIKSSARNLAQRL